MSSASSLFRRADGGVGVVSVLRSKASHNFLEINCLQVEFCRGHGCVIESSGHSQTAELFVHRAPRLEA